MPPAPIRFPATPLGASLLVGATLDAAFGLPLLVAPRWVAAVTGVPPPADVLSRLIGLLLLMLAAMYVHAAMDPERYAGVVAVAVAGRAAGALLFIGSSLAGPGGDVYLALGVAELGLGLAHALLGRDVLRGPPG